MGDLIRIRPVASLGNGSPFHSQAPRVPWKPPIPYFALPSTINFRQSTTPGSPRTHKCAGQRGYPTVSVILADLLPRLSDSSVGLPIVIGFRAPSPIQIPSQKENRRRSSVSRRILLPPQSSVLFFLSSISYFIISYFSLLSILNLFSF